MDMKLKMECLLSFLGLWSSLDERVECGLKASLRKDYISPFFNILNLWLVLNTHYGFTPLLFFFFFLDDTHHYLKLKINLNHLFQVFFRGNISYKYVIKTQPLY